MNGSNLVNYPFKERSNLAFKILQEKTQLIREVILKHTEVREPFDKNKMRKADVRVVELPRDPDYNTAFYIKAKGVKIGPTFKIRIVSISEFTVEEIE